MSKNTQPKPRLTRQDWINAAVQQPVKEGIGAGITFPQMARLSAYHEINPRRALGSTGSP